MSLRSSVRQMRESFEAQFDNAGQDRFLYRRNQQGEQITVTAEERDRFVRQYMRRIWLIMGGMMAVLLLFAGALIWWTIASNSELSDVTLYVGIGAISLVSIALLYWVRGAPARELGGRTPVGRERSRDEMRAVFFRKTSYGTLVGAGAFGAILPFMMALGRNPVDVLHGWGRLWLAFGAALMLLAAVQAFRKWRFESGRPNDAV